MDTINTKIELVLGDLRKTLGYIFFVMKLFGIFVDRKENLTPVEKFETKSPVIRIISGLRSFSCHHISRIYNLVFLFIAWSLVIRYTVAIFYGYPHLVPGLLPYRLLSLGYSLQSALELSIMARMFRSTDRFHKFLDKWQSFTIWAITNGCPNQQSVHLKIRRTYLILLVVLFAVVGVNMFLFFGISFYPKGGQAIVETFVDPLKRTTFNKITTGAVLLLLEVPWCISLALFVLTSKALSYQFQMLAKRLACTIEQNPNSYPKELEKLRQAHLKLSEMVEIVNNDFKHLLSVAYVLNIFLTMFAGYNVFKGQNDSVSNIACMLFWVICNISKVFILSLNAAHLHEKSLGSLPVLFHVNVKDIQLEESKQFDMFFHNLQLANVGFTVADFMLVRRETILTFGGFLLTYFFVIIQFNIS